MKPGDKKAAVSRASLESDPGEKIVYHAACSMCNRGCYNYSLFGLEVDDSGHSESSSPPPSEKVATRGRSVVSLPKGVPPPLQSLCSTVIHLYELETSTALFL